MATSTRMLLAALLLAAPAPALAAELPFAEAARLLLDRGPETAAARATLEGARVGARHAAALPGPSLSAGVENFGGRGSFRGTDAAEVTIAAAQPLPVGPRASARRALARAELDLAGAEADATARAQLATLARVYAEAAAARQLATIAEARLALGKRLEANAARRLAAGDIAEVEARRVEVEASLAAAAAAETKLEADAADAALARLVGEPAATAAPEWLATLAALPPVTGSAAAAAADAPLWAAERRVAEGRTTEARAERLPTADLMAGVRRVREADATVGVAGVTFGLPLWNGNRGTIAKAAAAARRAELEATIAAREAEDRRTGALALWQGATARLAAIEATALPAARRAQELGQRGYAAGALPYRDLADTTEKLAAVEEARVAALQAIAEARATLFAVTGDPGLLGLDPGVADAADRRP